MENVIDSDQAAEMLGISKNNLRQLVYRKLLVPVGKQKRRSLFNVEDVAKVKAARKPLVPSV
jgi:DNA-binding transcriptional MerR regulator